MAVTAPPLDTAGAALDAQIAGVQALVNQTSPANAAYPAYVAQLNLLQVEAVEHYMATGWLNAAAILTVYKAPSTDGAFGGPLTQRVNFLEAFVFFQYNKQGGWTPVVQNYEELLYAAQATLVRHIMDTPNGTRAATILATMTGTQTDPANIPFEYSFNSVGFTDADEDD
jgi:hypothetical protein